MYLRFIAYGRKRLRSTRNGLFIAAYDHQYSWKLSDSRKRELSRLLRWFSKELPIPDDEVFPFGKGQCWYKLEAADCIENMCRMSLILEAAGVRCGQIYNRNPGRVTYQDDFQIVAVDRFTFQT